MYKCDIFRNEKPYALAVMVSIDEGGTPTVCHHSQNAYDCGLLNKSWFELTNKYTLTYIYCISKLSLCILDAVFLLRRLIRNLVIGEHRIAQEVVGLCVFRYFCCTFNLDCLLLG